jgi:hypothetical protein
MGVGGGFGRHGEDLRKWFFPGGELPKGLEVVKMLSVNFIQ